MENLSKEQRVEKIKELAGDDISVIINTTFKSGIEVISEQGKQCIIMGNKVIN